MTLQINPNQEFTPGDLAGATGGEPTTIKPGEPKDVLSMIPADNTGRKALQRERTRAAKRTERNPMHLAIASSTSSDSVENLSLSRLLFDVLGRRPDEFTGIFWLHNGAYASAVTTASEVQSYVATLPTDANIYFGINPVEGPARERAGRGKNEDVTRLAALPIDLDVKGGGCPSRKVARAIIDELSEVLGTRPSAITETGGGLQPFWPVADGDVGGTEHVGALLKRWGRLVRAVAMKHGAAVDPVFELARVMRAPGTYNTKAAYADRRKPGEPGVPVTCVRDDGWSLTVAEIVARLDEAGVREEDSDRGNTSDRVLHDPDRWEPAYSTSPYVAKWLESVPEDQPNEVGSGGRHSWMLSQAVRFNCALALGQISEDDYLSAQQLVEDRLIELRAETGESVPPLEVYAGWVYAIEKTSRKTLDQLWDDYNGDRNIWPSPEESRPCARRVTREAALSGEPLCYWKGGFYRWAGTHWKLRSVELLEDQLGLMFENVAYYGADGDLRRWKPNGRKLTDVIKGIRALVRIMGDEGEERPAPCWLDGRDEPVVACRNGLVRLGDGVLLPHTADYFNTLALAFDYDPSAPVSQAWLTFLDQVFNGDAESIEALQLWFGYVLTGRTDLEQCLYLFGPGRSGKGTITHALQALVGLSSCAALSGSQFRGSTFAYEPLMGKSLGVLSDERVNFGKELVEAILRITGRDLISVNRKNKVGVSEHIAARLMFLSNVTPVLPDDAGAVKARLVVLHTPNQFNGENGNPSADEGLKDRLVREELPGILRWALEGARKLDGKITQPAISAKYADAIADSGSPITVFLREFFEFGDDDKMASDDNRYWIGKADAFALWKYWCDSNGHEPGSADTLKRKLIDTMPVVAPRVDFQWKDVKRGPKGEQRPAYAGLRLNEDGSHMLSVAQGRVTFRVEK
ncbi:phage/plasmid primase, P4 family [Mycobacterium intracellulare]|uniref:DNA primase family protein n=1 Tax=Mycobacterium intracellulare TaxID=1767 RepID=UPI0009BCF623|nr:phage/plasmid primase, P4 family [Mycobacterium intracellulare]MEE3801346.1 phage/plasmid primase, P4 family [Mycobacterium intracellulare]UQB86878.1 hypothetical protein KN249_23005 [Mycobacterium intracellulare]